MRNARAAGARALVFSRDEHSAQLFDSAPAGSRWPRSAQGPMAGAEVGVVALVDQEVLGLTRRRGRGSDRGPIRRLKTLRQLVVRRWSQVRSRVSGWKTMISSRRLMNSGRKWRSISLLISDVLHLLVVAVLVAAPKPNAAPPLIRSAPMLLVMIRITLRKSTCGRTSRSGGPSSMICSSMLKTSGCAFSISSSSTTAYGRRRIAR
jgi:hypothetical protein